MPDCCCRATRVLVFVGVRVLQAVGRLVCSGVGAVRQGADDEEGAELRVARDGEGSSGA